MNTTIVDLLTQKNHDLNKQFNKLYKIPNVDRGVEVPHIYNNILVPNFYHQVDVLHLPTDVGNYSYIVVVVDVFNSKCDMEAIKNVDGKSVVKALKTIYSRGILQKPKVLQMDKGTEFLNYYIDEFCIENNIDNHYNLTNRHRQQAHVEGRNMAIAKNILRWQSYIEKLTGKVKKGGWKKQLPELVEHYNNNLPKRRKSNFDDPVLVSDKKGKDEILPIGTKVYRILDYPKRAYNNKRYSNERFRAGDERWDDKIYYIRNFILNPNMPVLYTLSTTNDMNNNNVLKSVAYTRNQLQKVK